MKKRKKSKKNGAIHKGGIIITKSIYVTENGSEYTLQKEYRLKPGGRGKKLYRVTRIEGTTGKPHVLYHRGSKKTKIDIPLPDIIEPMPGGKKTSKSKGKRKFRTRRITLK